MKSKNLFFWGLTCLIVFGFIASCKKEVDSPIINPKVAFIHTCSGQDVTFLKIFLKDSTVFLNNNPVSHPNSIGYASILSGTYPFSISIKDSSTSFFNANIGFENNKTYTLIAANTKAKIELLKLEDNLSVPDSSKAYVRFVHLISNSKGVNILLDDVVVASNISYKTVIDFFPVIPAVQKLEIKDSQTNSLIASINPLKVAAGKKITIYTKGLMGGTGGAIPGQNLMGNN